MAWVGSCHHRRLDRVSAGRYGSGSAAQPTAQEAAGCTPVRPISRCGGLCRIRGRSAALAALLGDILMRTVGMRGLALLNVLLAISALAVLLAVGLPHAISLYARAATQYEAMCLIGELRRIQAISRTTAMPLNMYQDRRGWERVPRLRFEDGGYVLNRPFGETLHIHHPLPLVRFEQMTLKNTRVVFHRNGELSEKWSHNMTILVYAEGYKEDALRVVIDHAARIRLQRGVKHEE